MYAPIPGSGHEKKPKSTHSGQSIISTRKKASTLTRHEPQLFLLRSTVECEVGILACSSVACLEDKADPISEASMKEAEVGSLHIGEGFGTGKKGSVHRRHSRVRAAVDTPIEALHEQLCPFRVWLHRKKSILCCRGSRAELARHPARHRPHPPS